MGHTHEDIDAGFSRIAETLRTKEAETLPELKAILPDCHQIKALFDIKEWLEPHLNTISQHSKPLHFRFFKDKDYNVKVSYKGCFDQSWKITNESLLHSIPRGKPNLIQPNFEHINCEKFLKNLDSWKILFSDEGVQMQWWTTFINNIKEFQSNPQKLKKYSSIDNIWSLPKLPKQVLNSINSFQPSTSIIPEELQNLLNTEKQIPSVKTKSKKRSSFKRTKGAVKTCSVKNRVYLMIPIAFEILQKIWYFTVIMYLINFVGGNFTNVRSIKKVWLQVLRKHLGNGICSKDKCIY